MSLIDYYVGKKCTKKSGKPFKSRFKVNTITNIVPHPYVDSEFAFEFVEDDSKVSIKQCVIMEEK